MMESGYGILSNDYDWLDSFLRSFPGVTRDYKEEWQWIRYQVGEKMFAAVCKDAAGTRDIITVKLDALDGEFLRNQYEDIIPGHYMNKVHWNSIYLDGKVITGNKTKWSDVRQKIGMVFQSYELFPHMTVIDNILLGPLKVQKKERKEAEKEAEKLLERVGLLDRKEAFPRQLSGGQKQRVAIVRALIMKPEILLFDEVTAALDPEMVREVLDVMLELAKNGSTMVIVTHEMQFARAVADRIVFLDGGEIVEMDAPENFFTQPKTDRARRFLNTFTFEKKEG